MEESENNGAASAAGAAGGGNLELVYDVSVDASIMVGTCTMTMGEILQLEAGDVIQMNESADTPVLLYLNNKVVATGEIVLVEDRLGLKIVEILKE